MSINFKELFPKDLYHSYVLEGDIQVVSDSLLCYLEDQEYIEENSVDVLYQIYNSFTIDDSENIKNWHNEKAITKNKKICIIATKFINHDAERTLLKIIEEPSANTHFFIVVPNASVLLDTFLSRVHIIKTDKEDNLISGKNADEFLKSNPKKRIEIVSGLLESHKEEKGSGGLRSDAIELINELEKIIHGKFKQDKLNPQTNSALNELLTAREYLALPGSSVKMILEHVALVI